MKNLVFAAKVVGIGLVYLSLMHSSCALVERVHLGPSCYAGEVRPCGFATGIVGAQRCDANRGVTEVPRWRECKPLKPADMTALRYGAFAEP